MSAIAAIATHIRALPLADCGWYIGGPAPIPGGAGAMDCPPPICAGGGPDDWGRGQDGGRIGCCGGRAGLVVGGAPRGHGPGIRTVAVGASAGARR